MPSKTFLNLSKDKQEKILNAAVTEFSEMPFSEASINRIVKIAEISRGSFYMYFKDKYDLLMYLIHTLQIDLMKNISFDTKTKEKDLISIMVSIHDYFFKMYENEQYKKFMKNIIVFFQGRPIEEVRRIQNKLPIMNEFENIYRIIDLNQFKFDDKKSIVATIDIANAILKTVIFHTTLKDLTVDESREKLIMYLNILHTGYGKGNKEC